MVNKVNGGNETFWERVGGFFGSRRREDIISLVTNYPDRVPPVWLPSMAIASAAEYERLRVIERLEEAATQLRTARILTDYIYKNADPRRNVVFPSLRMDEGVTEGGALGLVIDPNKDYPETGQTYLLLKKVGRERGIQAFRDSQYFRGNPNFKLEHIVANIPNVDGTTSYLWKEFIIGPNLSDLFRIFDVGISRGSPEDKKLLPTLEEELTDIASKRVKYWQTNVPDSTDPQRDPETLKLYYQRSFMELVRGFTQLTDLSYSEQELAGFTQAVHNLDWNFLRRNKVARKVDATFKNMVILTGKINMDYSRFIELFTRNGGRKRANRYALEEHLFFVDTPHRYAHILEDPWEMDLSPEGAAKKSAVDQLVRDYERAGMHFTPEERLLVGAYRAFRKAYLVLSKYGPGDFMKLQGGSINREEFEQRQFMNKNRIEHLLRRGNELLQEMSSYVPVHLQKSFNSFAPTLQKLGGYSRIDYTKNGSSSS